jgi:hypothetical protein
VPQVLEFAVAEDVKKTHLDRGARMALVGLFGRVVYEQVCGIAAEDVGWVIEGCREDDYADYLLFSVLTTSITGPRCLHRKNTTPSALYLWELET